MSTTLDVTLKVLYVQGPAGDVDRSATEQLRKASSELHITTIAGSAAALAELRRTPGWQALFTSPSLPKNEVLALIASLRRDRIPIAIVPILDDAHQDLFASAVAAGADDVLVRRRETLVNINETLTRIRQSPHLFPAEQRRRISVLYAGRDPLVWNLLDQVPFVKAGRVTTGIDGTCPVRRPGAGDDSMRADAVIIDETPGEAHPLQVLKSVKAQASDLPVIMLTSAGAADIATAALELGADDTVLKTGIFRRRLIATLRRVHQRLELSAQQNETRTREERLRQIVENVPTGIMVVAGDGRVLAMNGAALQIFGASKPRDVVGRDFRELVATDDREAITGVIHRVTRGEPAGLSFVAQAIGGAAVPAHIEAVVLERDARGGRGVVASITRRTDAAGAGDATSEEAVAELATLRDSLQTLERHYAELEDARRQERDAWESERQQLATRVADAERLAAERQVLQERLDEVSNELARTSQSFAAERQALERRLAELEEAAREASAEGESRAALERALEAVREEQRQAIAAHALERSGWQDIRAELEARVQQLDTLHQSEHDTLVAALRRDVQNLDETLASERSRWETTREQLETELRNAREALWTEHTERDAARARYESELEALRHTLETEREEWNRTRSQLDEHLQTAQGTLDAERRDWEASREALEEARRQVETALDRERQEWATERETFEHDRRSFADHSSLTASLEAERSSLASQLDTLRTQAAVDRAALEAEVASQRTRAEQNAGNLANALRELDDARARFDEQHAALSAELERVSGTRDARITELEAELASLRDLAASVTTERDDLRQQLTAEQSALEATRAAERTEWHERLASLEAALRAATEAAAEQEAERARERAELLQAATETRTSAEQERGHLVSLHAREAEAWRQAVEQARLERDQAARRVPELEVALDEARRQLADVDTLRVSLEATRGEHQQAIDRVAALEHELGSAHERIAALDSDLAQARAQLGELDGLRASLDTSRGEHQQAVDRVAALEHELGVTRDRVATLERELDQARHQSGELDALRTSLESTRADYQQAVDRVTALEQELSTAHDRVNALGSEVAQAHQQRSEVEQLRSRLEGELAEARQQIDQLEQVRTAFEATRGSYDEALARIGQLELDLASSRVLADEHHQLAESLEAARNEIRHTDAAHHAEREEWNQRRQALEREFSELDARYHREREEWSHLRMQLEAEAAEATRLTREHQFLNGRIAALQAECSALSSSLSEERHDQDRLRHEVDTLRTALDEAHSRLSELDSQLSRAAAETERRLAEQAARHEARERALESEVHDLSERLSAAITSADQDRASLREDRSRARDAHARLVASEAFGYAVTTETGHLVECNDTFARIFGYGDAAEARERTANRPFPGLANRPEVSTRLEAEGRVDRLMSCVERVDGRAVRIIETAIRLDGRDDDGRRHTHIEHIIVAGPAGPTSAERQQRRMQEVGALAASMMAELEPLSTTAAARSAELAQLASARKTLTEETAGVRAATERVASLVRQLAGFSRRQRRAPEQVDLGQVVLDAQPMLSRLAGDYVAFTMNLGHTTPIEAQPDDVLQLLTSLVTLGRDLLPTGGTVLVDVCQEDGAGAFGVPGPVLSVSASGYGAQFPGEVPALDLVAERCGGTVRISGDAGNLVRLEVLFPRCGR